MKKTIWTLIILAAVLTLPACNPLEKNTTSSSFIVVESILGKDASGATADFVQSDVLKEADTGSYVTSDSVAVTLRANLLDPNPVVNPTAYQDITLDRYIVTYTRTDGKNREGVDVPYSFEGSLSHLLKIDASTAINIIAVREVAKLEPPLVALAQNRAEGVIQVTARIEFYGHDLANHTVKGEGSISIYFANYQDN
jgi:hypothetical protein